MPLGRPQRPLSLLAARSPGASQLWRLLCDACPPRWHFPFGERKLGALGLLSVSLLGVGVEYWPCSLRQREAGGACVRDVCASVPRVPPVGLLWEQTSSSCHLLHLSPKDQNKMKGRCLGHTHAPPNSAPVLHGLAVGPSSSRTLVMAHVHHTVYSSLFSNKTKSM